MAVRIKESSSKRQNQIDAAPLAFESLVRLVTASSVTIFGEISPLWQNFERLWRFSMVYLVFGQNVVPNLVNF